MVPSSRTLPRAQRFALPSTAARASPLRVWGGNRGADRARLSSCRCCGAVWFRSCGGGWGRVPARTLWRVRRTLPPSPRFAAERGVGGRWWAPGSQLSPRPSPVPPVAGVPPACVHDLGCSRDAVVCCAWCVPCASRAVRLPPRFPASPAAAFPRLAESRECPPPLVGAEEVCVWRDGFSLSGVGRCVGERLLAASGASSDAGTHCRSWAFVGRHGCVSASVSLALFGVSPWAAVGGPSGSGLAWRRNRRVAGTAQGS